MSWIAAECVAAEMIDHFPRMQAANEMVKGYAMRRHDMAAFVAKTVLQAPSN